MPRLASTRPWAWTRPFSRTGGSCYHTNTLHIRIQTMYISFADFRLQLGVVFLLTKSSKIPRSKEAATFQEYFSLMAQHDVPADILGRTMSIISYRAASSYTHLCQQYKVQYKQYTAKHVSTHREESDQISIISAFSIGIIISNLLVNHSTDILLNSQALKRHFIHFIRLLQTHTLKMIVL